MSQVAFDALVGELKTACKGSAGQPFPLEEVFLTSLRIKSAREGILAGFAAKDVGSACDLLLLLDVVATAASLEAARHDPKQGGEALSSDVVDLWIRAQAGRALWYERFVLWPSENSSKKLEHLVASAKLIGADSITRSLLSGVQPIKFTEFVAGLSKVTGA